MMSTCGALFQHPPFPLSTMLLSLKVHITMRDVRKVS